MSAEQGSLHSQTMSRYVYGGEQALCFGIIYQDDLHIVVSLTPSSTLPMDSPCLSNITRSALTTRPFPVRDWSCSLEARKQGETISR